MNTTKFYDSLLHDGKLISSFYESDPFHWQKIEYACSVIGQGKCVLDIGCNEGQIGEALIKMGNKVCGIDIVASNLREARKKGIEVKKVNIETQELPYADESFDAIVIADFIEHIFDTDALLRKCRRVLKKGGKLIITTPNIASLGRRAMLLFGSPPFVEHSIELPTNGFPSAGHIRYYTCKTLEEQLMHHKFKKIQIEADSVNLIFLRSKKLGKIMPSFGVMLMASCVK